MSEVKIKLVVQSYGTKRDGNGNRYWLARITSTRTGNSIEFIVGSDTCAVYLAYRNAEYDEVLNISEVVIGKHEYDRRFGLVNFHEYQQEEIIAKIKAMI